jgi:hypothetical protein
VKSDETVYIPKPDPRDPTKKVEETIWNHLARLTNTSSHRIAFGEQSVRLKVSGSGAHVDELRQRLSEEKIESLRIRLQGSEIIVYHATTTDGHRIILSPPGSKEGLRQASELDRLVSNRHQARVGRLLELKFTLLKAVTREEYEQALCNRGTHSAPAAAKLTRYDESLDFLLNSNLESKRAEQPVVWAQELRRIIDFTRVMLKSPYPHLDALLSIIDPENTKYRAVATRAAFQDFIKDIANCGIFSSFTRQGQAKLALQPIIKEMISSLPRESR